jgi:hypothetical protein
MTRQGGAPKTLFESKTFYFSFYIEGSFRHVLLVYCKTFNMINQNVHSRFHNFSVKSQIKVDISNLKIDTTKSFYSNIWVDYPRFSPCRFVESVLDGSFQRAFVFRTDAGFAIPAHRSSLSAADFPRQQRDRQQKHHRKTTRHSFHAAPLPLGLPYVRGPNSPDEPRFLATPYLSSPSHAIVERGVSARAAA